MIIIIINDVFETICHLKEFAIKLDPDNIIGMKIMMVYDIVQL